MKINKLLILVLCGINVFSQDFISTAKVEYEMILNTSGSLENYDANLYFNNAYSKFDYKNKDGNEKISEIKTTENNSKTVIKKSDTITTSIFINPEKNILYATASGEIVYEYNNQQKWELIDERKVIGNFECSKAVCSFRGRQYIAWYANSIPVIFGPWKFNGLPGLIIEIYDLRKEVYFAVKKINIPFSKNIRGIDSDEKLISREDHKKLIVEKLAKRKNEMEEKLRIIESSYSKENKVKFKISEPIISKGIEID